MEDVAVRVNVLGNYSETVFCKDTSYSQFKTVKAVKCRNNYFFLKRYPIKVLPSF